MKIICAWCGAVMADGPGGEVSHGICEPCEKKYLNGLKANRFWTFVTGRSLFWQFMTGRHPIVRERKVLI
jgi:hypothetical protein